MMHVVGYDLVSPNDTSEDYATIIDAIKTLFGGWCHIEKSVWLVNTNSTSTDIRETLKPYLHAGDILFVAKLSGEWASWNFGDERNNWIHAQSS
jgi:hypothetical protein